MKPNAAACKPNMRWAEHYYNGKGVARNPEQGAKSLQKAAEKGHIAAQCDLGVMYQKGIGVEQDYKATLKWFRVAAEQGDALAHNLGSLNAKGFKVKGAWVFNRTAFAFTKATQDIVHHRQRRDRHSVSHHSFGCSVCSLGNLDLRAISETLVLSR